MATTKKKINIVPRGKQVLVKVDEEESRESEFGIIVPDEVEQERKSQGTVAAVSTDEWAGKPKVGDRVIYGTYAGENLKIREDGARVDYKLLDDADVIAFIR